MLDFFHDWYLAVLHVLLESSHWLLFGFFAAGLLNALQLEQKIRQYISRPGLSSVLRASAFGIPLPLCSCSVIPVGVSLRRKGASAGATASFFISTPQIGVDSFLLTWGLLGPCVAVCRVLASFVSALVAGLGIDLMVEGVPETPQVSSPSCCRATSERSAIYRIFHFGFIELVDDLAVVLTGGILLAGLAAALLPADSEFIRSLGPFATVLAVLLISVPVYVCATSSTPFAAVLVAKGVSPGAALVFLLAGPATNISTILALKRELGLRALILYLLAIVSVAVLAAYLLDSAPFADSSLLRMDKLLEEHKASWLQWLSSGILMILLANSLIKTYTHRSAQ